MNGQEEIINTYIQSFPYCDLCHFRIHANIAKTVDLCRKAEAAGVSWITVHGRLSEERHQPVHYDAIKVIKDSLSIPVVANGDIKSLKEAENIHQLTGADGKLLLNLINNIIIYNNVALISALSSNKHVASCNGV